MLAATVKRTGNRSLNLKEVIDGTNTSGCDGKPCEFCHGDIPKAFTKSGNVTRENRIDCFGEDIDVAYHLSCYDMEVFGFVTEVTLRKLKLLKRLYRLDEDALLKKYNDN